MKDSTSRSAHVSDIHARVQATQTGIDFFITLMTYLIPSNTGGTCMPRQKRQAKVSKIIKLQPAGEYVSFLIMSSRRI